MSAVEPPKKKARGVSQAQCYDILREDPLGTAAAACLHLGEHKAQQIGFACCWDDVLRPTLLAMDLKMWHMCGVNMLSDAYARTHHKEKKYVELLDEVTRNQCGLRDGHPGFAWPVSVFVLRCITAGNSFIVFGSCSELPQSKVKGFRCGPNLR